MKQKGQNENHFTFLRLTGKGQDVFSISIPDRITLTRKNWDDLFGDLELIFAGPKRIILRFGKSSLFDKDLRELFASRAFLEQCKKMVVVLHDEFQEILMNAAAHEWIASGIILITYNEKEAEKII